MIIVRLQGGLGNQLFQYAFGKGISYATGTPVKFDASSYSGDLLRKVEILAFKAKVQFASRLEVSRIRYGIVNHLSGKLFRTELKSRPEYYKESSQCFDPRIFSISCQAYLDGYWQSERYFEAVVSSLREDLVLRSEIATPECNTAKMLAEGHSVSIHVRRGDYISIPANQKIYHSCDINYYRLSVKYFSEKYSSARFFVFSDDPEWVASHLLPVLGPRTQMVSNSGDPALDLTLMAMCRHHIIVNSSFSWWGAWLNPKPDKIVLAPKKWFNDPKIEDRDIIPNSWQRLF